MFAPPQKRSPWQARARWAAYLLSTALLIGGWFSADLSGKYGNFAGVIPSDAVPAALAKVALHDQLGAPLSGDKYAGKTLVLNFMFTRCASVCPLQTRALARVQRAIRESLKSQIHFLSVSVDPENDTPPALQRFAALNGVDLGNWSLATASPEATQQLTLQMQALDARDGGALPAAHGTSVYLFDRRGRLMQRYAGAPLDQQRLVREIERVAQLDPGDSRTAGL